MGRDRLCVENPQNPQGLWKTRRGGKTVYRMEPDERQEFELALLRVRLKARDEGRTVPFQQQLEEAEAEVQRERLRLQKRVQEIKKQEQ